MGNFNNPGDGFQRSESLQTCHSFLRCLSLAWTTRNPLSRLISHHTCVMLFSCFVLFIQSFCDPFSQCPHIVLHEELGLLGFRGFVCEKVLFISRTCKLSNSGLSENESRNCVSHQICSYATSLKHKEDGRCFWNFVFMSTA